MNMISVPIRPAFAAVALAAAALILFPLQASAGNPAQCTAYANSAVAQQGANIANGCGFVGPRWQAQFQAHFLWCIAAPSTASDAERAARQNMLNSCAAGGGGGGGGVVKFNNPVYNGLRLDWCRVWANQCGGPAATAYCQWKGYSHAVSWSKANNIGVSQSTRVISSGAVCSQAACDGFKWIRCSN